MQVQHDRSVYLYAVAGELVLRDLLAVIDIVRAEARKYGWTRIIWHREKIAPDGRQYTHIVDIPIEGRSYAVG